MTNTNTPTLFDFNGHNIRVVDLDGTPWFVAADVCKALGIKNARHAVMENVASNDVKRQAIAGQRGRPMLVVTEAGVYDLVMQSRKPEAQSFKQWVTGTVLPAIRKDGGYIMGEEKVVTGEMSEDELVLKAMEVMRAKIDRIAAERDALHAELYFVTVAEYAANNKVYLTQSQKNRLAHHAKVFTQAAGLVVTKETRHVPVRGQMIETQVNIYERDMLDKAAEKINLFAEARGTVRKLPARSS